MPTGILLLSIANLTVEVAQCKAQAAEVITLEMKSMKETGKEDVML